MKEADVRKHLKSEHENNNKIAASNKNKYANDQLTISNKKLFWLAMNKKKSINWKFAWVREGKIMVKKDESSPIIYIRKEEDIGKIK